MTPGKDRSAIPALLGLLLAAGAVSSLAGCKSKTEEMSEHPYFMRILKERWQIVLANFASDSPDINYVVVLLKDLEGGAESLEWTYQGPNREEAIAKLWKVAKEFRADLRDKVDMTGAEVRLLPGATVQDVGGAIHRCHKQYLEFEPMVKLE